MAISAGLREALRYFRYDDKNSGSVWHGATRHALMRRGLIERKHTDRNERWDDYTLTEAGMAELVKLLTPEQLEARTRYLAEREAINRAKRAEHAARARFTEQWAAYFRNHPEVAASYRHQTGGAPVCTCKPCGLAGIGRPDGELVAGPHVPMPGERCSNCGHTSKDACPDCACCASADEHIVRCTTHGDYLWRASAGGTTWRDDLEDARRYPDLAAAQQAADLARWLDHTPLPEVAP